MLRALGLLLLFIVILAWVRESKGERCHDLAVSERMALADESARRARAFRKAWPDSTEGAIDATWHTIVELDFEDAVSHELDVHSGDLPELSEFQARVSQASLAKLTIEKRWGAIDGIEVPLLAATRADALDALVNEVLKAQTRSVALGKLTLKKN